LAIRCYILRRVLGEGMKVTASLFLLFWTTSSIYSADEPLGAQLYRKHCATCHDSGGPRIPTTSALRQIPVAAIAKAMEVGVMRTQAASLTPIERVTVARWLGRTSAVSVPADRLPNRCASAPRFSATAPSWSTWGVSSDNRRFQAAEAAGLSVANVSRLKVKWAFAFDGAASMRSQPAVYGGLVFAGGPDGSVVALDAGTGCAYWSTAAAAQVRTGMVVATVNGSAVLYFGDASGQVYALDAATGKPLWQIKADDHPAATITGTPAYHAGRLYVPVSSSEEGSAADPQYVCCTFRGSLLALDATTGKVLWKSYTIPDRPRPGKPTRRGARTAGPSGAAIWSSPTIDPDRGVIYVTTGDNYSTPPTTTSDAVLAFSLTNGQLLWSQQITANDAWNTSCVRRDNATCPDSNGPDFDFGASAILVGLADGRRALVLPQKSGVLHAVDPDRKGRLLWRTRVGKGGVLGGIQWGAASDGSRIYVALSDIGFVRTGVPNTNSASFAIDPQSGGGIFAFRADNGERLWQKPPPGCDDRRPCSPAQSQAVSGIPGAVFSGSMDGHLRAYSTTDGNILWDYDAAHEFKTVNRVSGKGGAFDAGGVVVAGGMLFVGSGYGQWGALPGNVLLAFSVDGR
jgi:polyvinyl alcohol dehydrogenase (cytochrome)